MLWLDLFLQGLVSGLGWWTAGAVVLALVGGGFVAFLKLACRTPPRRKRRRA